MTDTQQKWWKFATCVSQVLRTRRTAYFIDHFIVLKSLISKDGSRLGAEMLLCVFRGWHFV